MATPSIALITSGTKELGSPLTLSMNPESSSYTHTLTYEWSGRTGTIGTGLGASTTWTPSLANMAPYLTTGTSATCTLTCKTYDGSTLIGTRTSVFMLSIPASVKPTISSVSVTDSNGYASTYGGYIAGGVSILSVEINASGSYGSTVSKYTAKLGSGTLQTHTNGDSTFDISASTFDSGSVILTTSAIDSRGRGAYNYKTINVLSYTYPSLTGTKIQRWNTSTGQPDDESSTVRVSVVSNICDVGNKNLNRATIQIQYKLQTASSWTTYTTRTNQPVSTSFNVNIPNLSENSRYQVRVISTDSFGYSSEYSWGVDTAKPVIDLKAGGNGIGLLGVSEQDGITFGADIYCDRPTNTPTNIYAKDQSGQKWTKVLSLSGGVSVPSLNVTENLNVDGASIFNGISVSGGATFTNSVVIPSLTAYVRDPNKVLTGSDTKIVMTSSLSNEYQATSNRPFSFYNGGIRVVHTGVYKITYGVQMYALDGGQNVAVNIYRNSIKEGNYELVTSSPNGAVVVTSPVFFISASSGDVLYIYGRSTGGGGIVNRAFITVWF